MTLDDELLLRNLSMKLLCLSFTALGIHYITELQHSHLFSPIEASFNPAITKLWVCKVEVLWAISRAPNLPVLSVLWHWQFVCPVPPCKCSWSNLPRNTLKFPDVSCLALIILSPVWCPWASQRKNILWWGTSKFFRHFDV